MLAVSQAWKNNQKKIMQGESDIRLSIYTKGETTATLKQVLTKKDVASFVYNESGSIINKILNDVEISFEVIKNGVIEYAFDRTDLVKVEYGYKINNSWEWVEKGVYEISECRIKQNDLNATYIAKYINNEVWQMKYYKGSARLTMNSNSAQFSNMTLYYFINNQCLFDIFENVNGNNERRYGNFLFNYEYFNPKYFDQNYEARCMGVRVGDYKYIEIAQLLSQTLGMTFMIKGSISSGEYNTNLHMVSIGNSWFLQNKNNAIELPRINQTAYPEIIENKRYKTLNYQKYRWNYSIYLTYYTEKYHSTQSQRFYGSGTQDMVIENGFVIGSTPNADVSSGTSYGKTYTITTTATTYVELWLASNERTTTQYTIDSTATDTISFTDEFELQIASVSYIISWLTQPKTYEYEMRIDPSIELFDLVYDSYSNMYFIVEGISLDYNGGGFKGKLTLKKIEYEDILEAPVYDSYTISGSNQFITITNNNDEQLKCKFLIGEDNAYWLDVGDTNNIVNGDISANASGNISTATYLYACELATAYYNYTNFLLDEDVYAYFEDGLGKVSDKTLIWAKNHITADPTIEDMIIAPTGVKFSFKIRNSNNFDMKVRIDYGVGHHTTKTALIGANSTMTITNTNTSAIANEVFKYANNLMTENITCRLIDPNNSSNHTNDVIILEANA